MNAHASLEATVRDLAQDSLAERGAMLRSAGLEVSVDVKRWGEGEHESSEITIVFWRGTAFLDVIEQFIRRDGRPLASPEEFRQWIDEAVEGVLAENAE